MLTRSQRKRICIVILHCQFYSQVVSRVSVTLGIAHRSYLRKVQYLVCLAQGRIHFVCKKSKKESYLIKTQCFLQRFRSLLNLQSLCQYSLGHWLRQIHGLSHTIARGVWFWLCIYKICLFCSVSVSLPHLLTRFLPWYTPWSRPCLEAMRNHSGARWASPVYHMVLTASGGSRFPCSNVAIVSIRKSSLGDSWVNKYLASIV